LGGGGTTPYTIHHTIRTWEPEADAAAEITLMSIGIDMSLKLLPRLSVGIHIYSLGGAFRVVFYNWHSDRSWFVGVGWLVVVCCQDATPIRNPNPHLPSTGLKINIYTSSLTPIDPLPHPIPPANHDELMPPTVSH